MPEAGDKYTYKGEEQIGNDGPVPGAEVRFREKVSADTPGAHDDKEDAVVIEWDAPSIVRTDKGNEIGTVVRAMSVSEADFKANFKKG